MPGAGTGASGSRLTSDRVVWLSSSLCGYYLIRLHHFVVLVFEDVAVPDVTSNKAFEANYDSRDHPRVGAHRIFPPSFARFGRSGRSPVSEDALVLIGKGVKTTPVQDLEAY